MNKKLCCASLVFSLMISFNSVVFAQDLVSPTVTVVDQYTIKGPKNYVTDYEAGDADGNVNAIIEIPKGTTGKWEVDLKAGTIVWEFKKGKPREVTHKGGYPVNYGSIPKTSMPKEFGGDGESVDIIVVGAPIPRGEVVKVKVIGLYNITEPGGYDGKIIGVKIGSPEAAASSVEELNAKFNNIVAETASWFENYKGADAGITVGIANEKEAMTLLLASIEAYNEKAK